MITLEIGNKVRMTEQTAKRFYFPSDTEFTITDILEDNVPYQIVVNAKEFGKDWVEFFKQEELILCL